MRCPARTTNTAVRIIYHFAAGENVRNTCRLAAIGRKTYYRWREDDPAIRKAFQEAREGGAEKRRFLAWLHHPFRGLRPPGAKYDPSKAGRFVHPGNKALRRRGVPVPRKRTSLPLLGR